MYSTAMILANDPLESLAPIFVMIGMFSMVSFIVWVVVNSRRRSEMIKAQAEIQSRLLERFGSAQEIREYLESDAGRKFQQSATIEPSRPHGRILGAMMSGIILLSLGVGFLLVRGAFTDPGDLQGFTVAGAIFSSLGLGFLLSSLAAFFLSKSWGLFNGKEEPHA